MLENISNFKSKLFESTDIAILVYFRIMFGGMMLWEVIRYYSNDWIYSLWIEPSYNFTYFGFEWIKPLPGDGMYFLFAILGILSILMIIGFKYRIAATLFFLGFTYVFLLEQTTFLNHFYLISLISFLLIFVPAHRALSIDSWMNKKQYSDNAPYWSLWILKFQISIVYFFGGIQKISWDWLHGEPLGLWLSKNIDFPIIGSLFTEEWVVYSFSYSSMILDFVAIPLLIWKKTRLVTFGFIIAFHLLNSQFFSIGIFPWFMILATLIFFNPSWPRFNRWVKSNSNHIPKIKASLTKNQKIIFAMILIFIIFQTTMPLRQYFYPGDANWTEEGHMFSWTMKLRAKDTTSFRIDAVDPATGNKWLINPLLDLSINQIRQMSHQPDSMVQYAHYVEEKFKELGISNDIEIRMESIVSLNGRDPELLIDPNVDLTEQDPTLFPKTWIIPYTNDLNPRNSISVP